jgi:hypothetical protein
MTNAELKKLYDEYESKFDEIIEKYGESDGFVIKESLWWDYYKNLIEKTYEKIEKNSFTLSDASSFYKQFGFGPKLYGRSFIENGIEPIIEMFKYLKDENIEANEKIHDITEKEDSRINLKGIGKNFITLFLTAYFPKKYMQWNQQTDIALKIVDNYPETIRGEKKSDKYLRINRTCNELKDVLGIETLTKMDNFLYCISKGYIGDKEEIIEIETTEIKEIEEEHFDKNDKHLEMMYYIVKIGILKGHNVWVAINDRNKVYNNEKLSEICLSEIPNFTQPQTIAQAKYIDVIWFLKNTANPVRFFEIEKSTTIYSGLLRFNDVKIDFPISKATIVIPEDRKNLFEKQINRRTFTLSELSDVCDHITFEGLKRWYESEMIVSKYD